MDVGDIVQLKIEGKVIYVQLTAKPARSNTNDDRLLLKGYKLNKKLTHNFKSLPQPFVIDKDSVTVIKKAKS